MKYRDTASFGKRQEYRAIAELLGRGYDVYQTLVDDQQIDCIVRLSGPNGPKYVDIQIKARSRFAQEKSWGVWPSIKLMDPRPNLIFIFYSEPLSAYSGDSEQRFRRKPDNDSGAFRTAIPEYPDGSRSAATLV